MLHGCPFFAGGGILCVIDALGMNREFLALISLGMRA
jgi:hypothetical protein